MNCRIPSSWTRPEELLGSLETEGYQHPSLCEETMDWRLPSSPTILSFLWCCEHDQEITQDAAGSWLSCTPDCLLAWNQSSLKWCMNLKPNLATKWCLLWIVSSEDYDVPTVFLLLLWHRTSHYFSIFYITLHWSIYVWSVNSNYYIISFNFT